MTHSEVLALSLVHASEQIALMRGESQIRIMFDLLANGKGFGHRLGQEGRARLCNRLQLLAQQLATEG